MKNRFAIIDLGSGSTKLNIVEFQEGNLSSIYNQRFESELRKGMEENNGNITDAAAMNNIKDLKILMKKASEYEAEKIKIITTEAMRKAKNSDEVMNRLAEEIGQEIILISQDQEADLFWNGLVHDFPKGMQIAALDIGGGSVQFMYGTSEKLEGVNLLKTGVFALMDQFKVQDPFTNQDIFNMEEAVRKEIENLNINFNEDVPFIHGSTAVLDFYQESRIPMEAYNFSKMHPYQVNLNYTKKLYQDWLKLSSNERLKYSPSLPAFAKGAVLGLMNLIFIAEKTGLKYELPSNCNITYGIAYAILEGKI